MKILQLLEAEELTPQVKMANFRHQFRELAKEFGINWQCTMKVDGAIGFWLEGAFKALKGTGEHEVMTFEDRFGLLMKQFGNEMKKLDKDGFRFFTSKYRWVPNHHTKKIQLLQQPLDTAIENLKPEALRDHEGKQRLALFFGWPAGVSDSSVADVVMVLNRLTREEMMKNRHMGRPWSEWTFNLRGPTEELKKINRANQGNTQRLVADHRKAIKRLIELLEAKGGSGSQYGSQHIGADNAKVVSFGYKMYKERPAMPTLDTPEAIGLIQQILG